ncbi:MAG TPA: transposase [Planctomycetota bacterium]|jgi:REP element-mobilizing transposase RayT
MDQFVFRSSYQRKLPHLQPAGGTLFVTFRLAGSIPAFLLAQWAAERERAIAIAVRISNSDQKNQALLQVRRTFFLRFEGELDRLRTGPDWLRDSRIAALVAESLRFRDNTVYDLAAYCIMPNHVHVVFTPRCIVVPENSAETKGLQPQYASLPSIMHSLKLYTATRANRILARSGQFWQHESYDHWVRDENELGRVIRYVVNNPVKAGLARRWQDWPWTFSRFGEER